MRRIAVVLLIALISCAWLFAPTLAKAADAADPKPEELLHKVADYLAGLPALSCNIDSSIHIQAQGIDNRMDTKMRLRLERPNRLAIVLDEGLMGMTVISDGKELTQYLPTMNRYTVKEAPADLKDWSAAEAGMMGVSGEYLAADADKFYKALIEGVTKSEYLGVEEVDSAKCHHLRFEQEQFDWEIWIDAGEKPLVCKIVPDLTKQFTDAEGFMQGAKMEYVVTFKDWNVEPKFTEADFAFTPPDGATKVENLFEGLADAAAEEEAPHALLGQPAPGFKTVGLDDKPIDLAAHVGKDVVMLDFWATWCGPCVQAMPKVDGVAKKFAERGLVFYAVNVQEDAETIKEFLKTSELEVPVAMDADGKITESYGVSGIPQTVLIGKDGKVQVVHIGYSDRLGEQLSQQVEDLLAGKDLAAEALKKAEEASQAEETEAEEPQDAAGDNEEAAN
jgi:peroxiredoxin